MENKQINLSLHVTERCNMSCTYCYIDQGASVMPLGIAKKAVDFVVGLGRENIILSFVTAEPLVEWELIKKIIRYAQTKGIKRFDMATNCLLLDKEKLEYCVDHNVVLQISVDGRKKIHAMIRKHDKCDTQAILDKKLDLIRKYYTRHLEVRVTYTPRTVCHLSDTFKYIVEKGLTRDTRINFSPVVFNQDWRKKNILTFRRQLMDIADLFIKYRCMGLAISICYSECFPPSNQIVSIFEYKDNEVMFCRAGSQIISVDFAGNIWPCYWLGASRFKDKEKLRLGNIFDKRIDPARIKRIAYPKRNPYLSCRAWNFLINKDSFKPVKAYKDFYKVWVEVSVYTNNKINIK